jgi:hypothetical protein
MIPPEPFEDVRRERDQARAEREALAGALAAVLALADEWAGPGARDDGGYITRPEAAHELRAAVAAPLKNAGEDIAARLDAYAHLARLRAEVEAAQAPVQPRDSWASVVRAARNIADGYAARGGALWWSAATSR